MTRIERRSRQQPPPQDTPTRLRQERERRRGRGRGRERRRENREIRRERDKPADPTGFTIHSVTRAHTSLSLHLLLSNSLLWLGTSHEGGEREKERENKRSKKRTRSDGLQDENLNQTACSLQHILYLRTACHSIRGSHCVAPSLLPLTSLPSISHLLPLLLSGS